MSCQETEARLTDLLDRRLTVSDEIRLHAHVEGCASCRERVATWEVLTPVMRRLAPPRLPPLAIRRMDVEIERALAARAAVPRRRWWPWRWQPSVALGLGAAAAAAIVVAVLSSPPAGAPGAGQAFATVARVSGAADGDRLPLRAGAPLGSGAALTLAAGAEVALALDGRAAVVVDGPARLALLGDSGRVRLRLDAGTLTADVAHRRAGETFVVTLGDTRVEVRGTRFQVGYGEGGGEPRPWISVIEGRVAVATSGQPERLVSAGETFRVEPPVPPAPVEEPPVAPAPPDGCASPRPAACERLAGRTRAAMRARRYARALALADQGLAPAAPGCPASESARTAACLDDLRYLRAEALRLDGRLDQAVATYRALDRPPAPAAMRQNALYAAGQLEQRLGRPRAALADFERALAVAPRGALREEAMLGAMDAAAALGDGAAAAAAARRYLASFPAGRGAAAARRLGGGGSSGPAPRP